jgi:hypothetical protein
MLFAVPVVPLAQDSPGCPTGAQCKRVDVNGRPLATGNYTAQCTGIFPDFIDRVDENHSGRRFRLRQDYPTKLPPNELLPWLAHDFKTAAGADAYMMAVRAYIYEGMREADWWLEDNKLRNWYHVPWMTTGRHPREFLRGLTDERPLTGPELGIKPGVTVQNWAVGFYNSIGAFAIGRIWNDPNNPNPAAGQVPEGTVVAKVLFTAARPQDFSGADPVAGAPTWRANIFNRQLASGKEILSVRLMQMDIAIRDKRAGVTGWVFGTFAYDATAKGADPWDRMMPVGLMWGNDPALSDSAYQQGSRARETIVSKLAPSYAVNHLGRSGRMNGPIDNPVSACMSCHATAQTEVVAPMTPMTSCKDKQILHWFRNLPGTEAFGAVDRNTCEPVAMDPARRPVALDYSLQFAVAIGNQRSGAQVNPCVSDVASVLKSASERVGRDNSGVETFSVQRE